MSQVKDSAGSTQGESSTDSTEKIFITITDEAVNQAIQDMYLDFKDLHIKDTTFFNKVLKQVSVNKKINLKNAEMIYSYVSFSLHTSSDFFFSKNQNLVDIYKGWLVILGWLEIYFKIEEDEFMFSTEEEIEDALIEQYQDSEQYEIDSLKDYEDKEDTYASDPDY